MPKFGGNSRGFGEEGAEARGGRGSNRKNLITSEVWDLVHLRPESSKVAASRSNPAFLSASAVYCASALSHGGNARLKQLIRGQPEETGYFVEVSNGYFPALNGIMVIQELVNPRLFVAAVLRQRGLTLMASQEQNPDVFP